MSGSRFTYHVALLTVVVLGACNSSSQKGGLYDLPGRGAPIDYDSYYSAPSGSNLCVSNSINEAPSCGGP